MPYATDIVWCVTALLCDRPRTPPFTQALLSLLEDSPSVLQSAFAGRTQADPESAAAATAARHKLLLLGDLPAVLGEAVPTW